MKDDTSLVTASFLLAFPENKIDKFGSLLLEYFSSVDGLTSSHFKIYPFPVIQLKPNPQGLKKIGKISWPNYEWLVFTSSYAAQLFFENLESLKVVIPQSIKIATVGPSVSEIVIQHNHEVFYEANKFNSLSLAEELKKKNCCIAGSNFLLIRGDKSASDPMIEVIEQNGGKLESLEIYNSQVVDAQSLPGNWKNFHEFVNSKASNKFVCFSSPVGVENFYNLLVNAKKVLDQNIQIICIGPATHQKVQQLFPKIQSVCPTQYSYNGMLNEIAKTLHQHTNPGNP